MKKANPDQPVFATPLDKAINGATAFLFDYPHPRLMIGNHEFDLEQLLLAAVAHREHEKAKEQMEVH